MWQFMHTQLQKGSEVVEEELMDAIGARVGFVVEDIEAERLSV